MAVAVRQIPWKFLMEVLRNVRNTFYKKSQPNLKQIVVTDLSVDELESRLRNEAYFEEAEEYTYKYEGEMLNLRRPAGVEDGYQMAVHLRGVDHPDGIEIFVHYEPSRFNHPRAHLKRTIFSWEEGKARLTDVFDDLGIEYKPTE